MKPVILLATFAAFALTAAAQQPVGSQQTAGSQSSAPPSAVAGTGTPNSGSMAVDPMTLSILRSAGCPVGLKASFNSSSQMIKVHKPGEPDPGPPRGPSQHIRLSLGSHAQNPVVSVRVTAFGLNARGRLDRTADSDAYGASEIRRSMDIAQFFTAKDGTLYADLVLPGFTAVNSVKLESIRFADGSTRSFTGQSLCSIPVDGVMLVSGR
jgi:hypothetical protein